MKYSRTLFVMLLVVVVVAIALFVIHNTLTQQQNIQQAQVFETWWSQQDPAVLMIAQKPSTQEGLTKMQIETLIDKNKLYYSDSFAFSLGWEYYGVKLTDREVESLSKYALTFEPKGEVSRDGSWIMVKENGKTFYSYIDTGEYFWLIRNQRAIALIKIQKAVSLK